MPKFNFNLRRTKGAFPTPVRFLIRWNGQCLTYPTGETIEPKHWCSIPGQRNYQRAKETKAFPEYPEFNERLDGLLITAKATFRQFAIDKGREPELGELREALDVVLKRSASRPTDLWGFISTFIGRTDGVINAKSKKPLHRATLGRYRVTQSYLKEFVAQHTKRATAASLPFSAIDPDFIEGFAAFLTKGKGFSANTVSKYMRTLRLFLNRAKEDGHEMSESLRARRLSFPEEITDQIYLNEEELDALHRVNLSRSPRLERARDLFLVGAWTGLRFGDLSSIRPEHIEGNRIRITTTKTGRTVGIPLHPIARAIIDKYEGHVPSGISNQKQNDYIKEAAALVPSLQAKVMAGRTVAGVRREVARAKWEMVTTHTARRSFASNLYRKGVPARTIMTVTGHTTEQAFMRYIRLKDEEHMDIIAASDLFQPKPVLQVI